MQIRPATIDDLPRLVELGRAMHAESPRYRRLTYAGDKVRRTLGTLIRSSSGFVAVAEDSGQIFGVLAGYADEEWHSHEIVAHDLGVFVEPTARGAAVASMLIARFKAWAAEAGAVFGTLGVSTGIEPERTAALYANLGLQPVGPIFEFVTEG